MDAQVQQDTEQDAVTRTLDAARAGYVFSAMRSDGTLPDLDHDTVSELARSAAGNTFAAAEWMGAGADAGNVPPERMFGMIMESYYDAVVEADYAKTMKEVGAESSARLDRRLTRLARRAPGGGRGLMDAMSDLEDSRIRQIEEDFVFA